MSALAILAAITMWSHHPLRTLQPGRGQDSVVTAQMPDTPVGRRTAAFLAAFSAGTEAMEAFISEQMTPTGVSPTERAKSGEAMRERLGRVTFNRVLSAEGNKLVIVANAEKVGLVKVTTEVQAIAPYLMLPCPDFNPYP